MFEAAIGKRWMNGLFLLLGLALIAPQGCKPPDDKSAKKDDSVKKAKKSSDDGDEKSGASGSDDDDDDDEPASKKKKKKPAASASDDDDDDDAPTTAKKKPHKKPAASASDDDDDDDTTAAKKKKPSAAGDDDDDDDDTPAPKKKPSSDGIDVTGSYSLRGAGPDGKSYSGKGTVSKIGGEMYDISWVIGGSTYKGIAFRDADILSCGWTDVKSGGDNDRDLGVIAYLVKDDGNTLDGVWFEPGETSLGKELLAGGSDNLTGAYTIKSGETPTTHKKYSGKVDIALKSGVYNLTWKIGTGVSKGFGIRNGNVLSAAFTDSGGTFGVMQYRISKGGNVLAGQWAQTGQATAGIGTETMTKQ